MESHFTPLRTSTPSYKPGQFINPFTLTGFELGKREEVYTEAGPWSWQWHHDIFDVLPDKASKFFDAAHRLELKSELGYSPFLTLMRATDELNVAMDRMNSVGVLPNVNAQDGYRKNCAAAMGQWETLYARFKSKLSYRSSSVSSVGANEKGQPTCTKPNPVPFSSGLEHQDHRELPVASKEPRVDQRLPASLAPTSSTGEQEHLVVYSPDAPLYPLCIDDVSLPSDDRSTNDLRSIFDDCPGLLRALSSPIAISSGTLSTLPPASQLSSAKDNVLMEHDDAEKDDLWIDGFGDFGDTFCDTCVAKILSEDEGLLNDENDNPRCGPSNLWLTDPLLIMPIDLRSNRSPFAVLYEQLPRSSPLNIPHHTTIEEQQPWPKMNRRGALPPPGVRTLTPEELTRLETLHERAKCIDDWMWVFGEVDIGSEEEATPLM